MKRVWKPVSKHGRVKKRTFHLSRPSFETWCAFIKRPAIVNLALHPDPTVRDATRLMRASHRRITVPTNKLVLETICEELTQAIFAVMTVGFEELKLSVNNVYSARSIANSSVKSLMALRRRIAQTSSMLPDI